MKIINKVFILVFCLICSSNISLAQNGFSVKAGGSFSNVYFTVDTATVDTRYNLGLGLGVEYTRALSEIISVNAGIYYVQKGFEIQSKTSRIDYLLNYADVPLKINFKFDLETFYINFNGGFYFSTPLYGRSKRDGEKSKINFGNSSGSFKQYDLGFVLGMGVDIEMISFGINYNVGIIDIASAYDENIKNRSLFIYVGYKF